MRRKIYKMICVAVACMSLTACDSWLDVDPSDQYSTETFWKTKEHASAGIMGCYNALKPWRSLHTMEFDMLTAVSYTHLITAYNLGEYIDHLIEELPERRRVIFNLSRKEHKSYKEIAFQLNISEKTVENQISEALKFLKKNIMLLIWFI